MCQAKGEREKPEQIQEMEKHLLAHSDVHVFHARVLCK